MSSIRHVLIRGRVQGVAYRAWTQMTALNLGLEGWVRNRRGGEVEALFKGSAEAVASMIDACRQGPPGARVDDIMEREGSPADMKLRRPGERFSVAATA
jgi:acylphosphatase